MEMIQNWVHYNLPGALTQAFNHVFGNIQYTLFLQTVLKFIILKITETLKINKRISWENKMCSKRKF